PCGNAADQTAAANGDKQRIQVCALLFEFDSDRSLPEERLHLIEGMDRKSTRARNPSLAGCQGIRVALAGHDQIGAIFTQALHLRRSRYLRDKDFGWDSPLHGGVGDRHAVIAPGSRGHAGGWYVTRQQICERSARLE